MADADLGNVINVAILPEGRTVAPDNMNVVAIMTSNTVLSSSERYRLYTQASAVNADFGTTSEVAKFAQTFFGTKPNAVNFGGVLVIGYWRAVDETVAASAAVLLGEQLSEAATIPVLQTITDGSFDIDVDGVTVNVIGVDFSTTVDLEGVATLLNTEVTGATVTLDNSRIKIVSDTTGATSLITFATEGATGTYLGSVLGLNSSSAATTTQGAVADSLTAESKVEALTALKEQVNFKGSMFIDNPTDVETEAIALWVTADNSIHYDVFEDPTNLEVNATNPVWKVKLAGQSNYRCLYSKAGNRMFAASYMARAHTVNFSAENSAITMHLKELNVAAESYEQTEITKAKTVGLDIYTTFKSVPKVLTSGANDFVDNVYNLIAFADSQQVTAFNVLGTTATKIAQTEEDFAKVIDALEKDASRFVRAGVFAPGTWSSPDTFGDLDTFERNIENNGFYYLGGTFADQPQSERQQRIAPVIQGAVKNSGAIHKVNILINFNL